MFHQETGKAGLTFQDVVAGFSREEWDLLHKWQKDLYSNLMKDIHQVLMMLGPVIASSVFSLKAKEPGGLGTMDDDKRHKDAHTPSASVMKLDEFTMSSEESQCQNDPLNTSKRVRPLFSTANIESPDLIILDWDIPSTLGTGEFSVAMSTERFKEEREDYAVSIQKPEEVTNLHNPTGFLPLTSDPKVNCPDPVDGDTRDGCSGVDAGMEEITALISSPIKEEVAISSLGRQDSGVKRSIHCLLDDPVAASVASQSFTDENTLFQQETEDDPVNAACRSDVGNIKGNESHTSSWKKQSKIFKRRRRITCTECDQRFNKKALFVAHQRIHDGLRPFPCTKCERSFTRLSCLRLHQSIHTGIRPFHCNVCEKSFVKRAHLLGHQLIHTGEKPYQCPECEKSFTKRHSLQIHLRIHTGERPFQCTECEKRFIKKTALQQHQHMHAKVKPYPCSECAKTFSIHANLLRHQRIHTGVRPYSCTECDRSFTTKANLVRHQIIHTGVRPFHCTECEKGFIQKSDLQYHQSKHTGVRPFKCNNCEKSFIVMYELQNHIRTHTGERPYHCTECEKRFFQKQDLVKHLRIHTREK